MTLEQHLKQMIGDLVLTVARLQAEIDLLKADPPKLEPPPKETL